MAGPGNIGTTREAGGAVPESTGAAGAPNTSDTAGGSSAIGRASAGLTGLSGDSSSGDSVTGGQAENTTLGTAQTSKGGGNLGLGDGAAGGLGLHGDRQARERGDVVGANGGASGSATDTVTVPGGRELGATPGIGGGLGGPSGAGTGAVFASGADGREEDAGLRGTAAMNDDRADEAASPDQQDGSTTAAIGGSIIDRVTTGQGGDVGGGLTGPG